MLRGKSPCLGAESATGRPEDPWLWSRHRSTRWVVVLGLWSFAAAKLCHERLKERQLNGAHSFPCLPPAYVGQMASQVSFDLKFWMMMPCGSFLLLRLQTIQCQSNMHASEFKFSNLICQQLLVRFYYISDVLILEVQQFNMSADACSFWFGRLHSICSFLGGRTSMATQRTHRELAPRYAAGKVPVPWGRECHWETRRPWLWSRHRSTRWVVVLGLWSFAAAKLCHERLKERQLNGAHSFHASLLHMLDRWHRKSVLTWSFGWWCHVVAFYCCGCKQSSVKATCTPASTRCDCFYFWRLDSWSSAI